MRPAHADPRHRFRRSPSLSYPLSLCCAVSPFEALVHALDCADIEGEDSAISPLTQATLDRLVADPDALRKMSAYLQYKFTIRGSGQPLSEKQAANLAVKAVMCLSSGAFLLQPCTLVCYRSSFSSSPADADGVSWPAFAFTRCAYPCGAALSPRQSRYGGVAAACGRLHECSVMHRVTCKLCWCAICLFSALVLGARACDEQGPKHGSEQELLLVCRRPRLIS